MTKLRKKILKSVGLSTFAASIGLLSFAYFPTNTINANHIKSLNNQNHNQTANLAVQQGSKGQFATKQATTVKAYFSLNSSPNENLSQFLPNSMETQNLPWYNLNGFLNAWLQASIDNMSNTTLDNANHQNSYQIFCQAIGGNLGLWLAGQSNLLSSIIIEPSNTVLDNISQTQINLRLEFQNSLSSSVELPDSEAQVWNQTPTNKTNYNKNVLYFNTIVTNVNNDTTPFFNFSSTTDSLSALASVNANFATAMKAFMTITNNQSNLGINQFQLSFSGNATNVISVNVGFYNMADVTNVTLPQLVYNGENSTDSSNTLLKVAYNDNPIDMLNAGVSQGTITISLQTNNGFFVTKSWMQNAINNDLTVTSPAFTQYLTTQLFGSTSSFQVTQFTLSSNVNNGYTINEIWLTNTTTNNWINPFFYSTTNSIFTSGLTNVFYTNANGVSTNSGILLNSSNNSLSIVLNNPAVAAANSNITQNETAGTSVTPNTITNPNETISTTNGGSLINNAITENSGYFMNNNTVYYYGVSQTTTNSGTVNATDSGEFANAATFSVPTQTNTNLDEDITSFNLDNSATLLSLYNNYDLSSGSKTLNINFTKNNRSFVYNFTTSIAVLNDDFVTKNIDMTFSLAYFGAFQWVSLSNNAATFGGTVTGNGVYVALGYGIATNNIAEGATTKTVYTTVPCLVFATPTNSVVNVKNALSYTATGMNYTNLYLNTLSYENSQLSFYMYGESGLKNITTKYKYDNVADYYTLNAFQQVSTLTLTPTAYSSAILSIPKKTYSPILPNAKTTAIDLTSMTLSQFQSKINVLLNDGTTDYFSFTQYLLHIFFPNWFRDNQLIVMFDTQNNSFNWITDFLTNLQTQLSKATIKIVDNTETITIAYSPNAVTMNEALYGLTTINTYSFTLTFAKVSPQLSGTVPNVPNVTFNVANYLSNESSIFTPSVIANTGNLYASQFTNSNDIFFGSSYLSSALGGYAGLNLSDFYDYLLQNDTNNAVICQFMGYYLQSLYQLGDTNIFVTSVTGADNFINIINQQFAMSNVTNNQYDSNLGNGIWSVIAAQVNGTYITQVQLMITTQSGMTQYINLSNLTFTFTNQVATQTININNVQNALQWAQWLDSGLSVNKLVSYVNGQLNIANFNSTIFANTHTLSLTPQDINLINTNYTNRNNASVSNAFNYDNLTGYIPVDSSNVANWLTWSSFTSFFNACCLQTSTDNNPANSTIFNGIQNLVIANVNFSDLDLSTLFSQLSVWFHNLTSLTLQNCQLSGTFDYGTYQYANSNAIINSINVSNNPNLTKIVVGCVTSGNTLKQVASLEAANCGLTNVSSYKTNGDLILPTTVLDLQNNVLSSITPKINTTSSSNPAEINLSYNNFESLNITNWLNLSSTDIVNYFENSLNFNISYNNLLSVNGLNLSSLNGVSNQNGVWDFYAKSGENNDLPLFSLNFTNQNATGKWFYTIVNNGNNQSLTPAYTANNNAVSTWYNTGESYGVNIGNIITANSTNSLKDNKYTPNWLATTDVTTGIMSQLTYNQTNGSINALNSLLTSNENNNTTLMTNGLYMLNTYDMQNTTLQITNSQTGLSSAAILYSTFQSIYGGLIPFNLISMYQILELNGTLPETFTMCLNYFQQGFNLSGQMLQRVTYTEAENETGTISRIASQLSNMNTTNITGGYIGIYNNYLVLKPTNTDYFYISTTNSAYTPSINTYATITLNNTNAKSVMNLNVVLINNTQIPSIPSTNIQFANGQLLANNDEITLGNVWRNNGISGFWNLYTSGILTTLNNDPFDNGVDYAIYYNFLNDNVYDNKSAVELIGSLNLTPNSATSFLSFGDQANLFKKAAPNQYQNFENNFYHMLETESLIPYHQVNSLYGTYNTTTGNFTFSSTLLDNSQITLDDVTNIDNIANSASTGNNYLYGVAANGTDTLNNLLLVDANQSSFYQSSLWANFVDTDIGNNQTLGNALYENGTWTGTNAYQMPSSNNSVFNNSVAKAAYDNLMNLLGFATNLTTNEFNSQILNIYPNYYAINNSEIGSVAYTNYAKPLNNKSLFNIFTYDNGTIVNQFALYSYGTSNNFVGLKLSYINKFGNIANTTNYLFNLSLYGQNYFSKANMILSDNSNLLESETRGIKMSPKMTPYSWTQLTNNETMNLIPYDVINNINSINGSNSSSWIPNSNYAELVATKRQDFIIDTVLAVVASVIVVSILSGFTWLIVRESKKNKKKRVFSQQMSNEKMRYKMQDYEINDDNNVTDLSDLL